MSELSGLNMTFLIHTNAPDENLRFEFYRHHSNGTGMLTNTIGPDLKGLRLGGKTLREHGPTLFGHVIMNAASGLDYIIHEPTLYNGKSVYKVSHSALPRVEVDE